MSLVRIATPEDLQAIAALEKNWADEGQVIGFVPGGLSTFADCLDSVNRSLWVAEADDRVIGYVSATTHETSTFAVVPPNEPYIEIDDLYVCPKSRSRSVGARLVDAVLEFARAHHVHYATVFTASTNVAQIMRFYEKQGFVPWGIQFFRQL